jgi:hypothetical protein
MNRIAHGSPAASPTLVWDGGLLRWGKDESDGAGDDCVAEVLEVLFESEILGVTFAELAVDDADEDVDEESGEVEGTDVEVAGDVMMADVGTGEGYSAHRLVNAFRILYNILMHLSIAQSSDLLASSGSHVSSAHSWTSLHQVFRQRQVRLSGAHVLGVGGALLLLLMHFAAQSGRMRSARTSRKAAKMTQRTSVKVCMIPVIGKFARRCCKRL